MLRKIIAAAEASTRQTDDEPAPARKLRRRLGADGVTSVVNRYEAGESVRTISRSIEASGDAVLRLLAEEGVRTRQPRYLADTEKADVVRRYEAGESTYRIASTMGIPKTTVARTLQRAGVSLRSRGRSRLR